MYKIWLGAISLLGLVASFESCKPMQKLASNMPVARIEAVNTDTLRENIAANRAERQAMAVYQAENTRKHDLLHTRLDVRFDWAKQQLIGTAILTLKPYFYPQDSLYLDAKGFDIQSVELVGEKAASKLSFGYNKQKIAIRLPKSYTRDDTFLVQIQYIAKPTELTKGGSTAITDDRGLYFINPDGQVPNKPKQIWTQGETEAASCWFPTIDSPNERCTQEMYITVDKAYTTLSNGTLVYSKENSNGTHTDCWKQDKPHAPYLFMMAVGDFAVVKDKWRNLELTYLVEKDYEKYAKNIFGRTPQMLEFFSNVLNYPYPWDKYAQVVVRDYVSGAMENTGAVIFGEFVQKDARELIDETSDDIIAHEMFHHWFGDLVTCESWSNLPLNESFATYAEYLWLEHKHGRDEADYHLQNDRGQYFVEAEDKQEPLIRYQYTNREDMFDAHSYQKGGMVLHMLRKYVGDEAFFKSLNLYLKRNAYNKAEIHQLRLAFEEITGEDLNWFFNQWFLSAGHPLLTVSQTYENGKVKLTVRQRNSVPQESKVYRLPLQVAVWVHGKPTFYPIVIHQADQSFEFPVAAKPDLVLFDAETQLLGKVTHTKSEEEWMYQYAHSDKFFARYEAFNSLFEVVTEEDDKDAKSKNERNKMNTPERKKLAHDALNDQFWVMRQIAVRNVPESGSQMADFESVIEKMATTDPRSYVRAEAIQKMISWKQKDFQAIYRKALTDSSYYVVAAALVGYLRSQPLNVEAQLAAFRTSKNSDILLTLGAYYAARGNSTQLDWFIDKFSRTDVNFLYPFTQIFGEYLIKQPVDVQKKGVQQLNKLARTASNEYIRFNAYQTLGMFEDLEGVKDMRKQIQESETNPKIKAMYQDQ